MHTSFIDQVLSNVWDGEQNLENTVFVLPSRRAGTYLRNSISHKASGNVFAPKIYSIEQFIEQLSGLSYATLPEQLFCLYKAHLEVAGSEKESFFEFSRWARVLLADFDEIDRYLIPHKDIFSYLAAITEVNHWYLRKEKTSLIKDYIKFWERLEPLYQKFVGFLLEKKLGHQGLIYRTAFERLDLYLESSKNYNHVFLGFNALNTAESKIIQNILQNTNSDIYWDIDQYFLEESYHDAGYFIRRHQKSWKYFQNNGIKGVSDHFLAPKNIEIIGVPKNVSQVKYIGHILDTISEHKTVSLDNTALILSDESLLNPLINSLPAQLDSANITMGYPLKNSPLTGVFEEFFDLFQQSNKRGWYYKKIIGFLSLPYIQLLLSDSDSQGFRSLRVEVKKMNMIYLPDQFLDSYLPEVSQVLFNPSNLQVGEFLKSCFYIIEGLKRELEKKKHRGLEVEQLFGFNSIFKQLDEMHQVFPYISDIRALQGLYHELMAQQTIDFEGEPLKGLQIMGMLESRVLDFETVIISSVNEGILPAGKQGNSFIPFDVKKELGLPAYKEKDAVYTYHFYRLLQRAKKIYILYNTEPDVLLGGEKSRLIHQLQTDKNTRTFIKDRLATMELPNYLPAPEEFPKSEEAMSAIQDLANRGFSPTSLIQYIRNPQEFYKRALLRIEEPTMVDETIAANTFGTIIHNSLEAVLKPFVGQILDPKSLQSILPDIRNVVLSHFTEFYSESSIHHGKNYIVFQVLVRTVENFIKYEISICRRKKVRIIQLEKRLKIPLDIPGILFPVFLKGTLDRIDEVDGRLRIVDYKTGKVNLADMGLSSWEDLAEDVRYSKVFQVLSYAYMYTNAQNNTVLDGGVISLKNLSQGYLDFALLEKKGSRKRHPGIDQDRLQSFERVLFQLIREICNPDVPFVEKVEPAI
ncbi:MAG: PD-(D/E)XK nuclease family protein [Flavobacteriaceae bacterium]